MEEVFPETAGLDLRFQVAVGRLQQPRADQMIEFFAVFVGFEIADQRLPAAGA